MVHKLCSVFDKAAAVYNAPFSARTQSEAARHFMAVCDDATTMISKFPDDYMLYELGEFDDNSAGIQMHDHPVLIMRGVDYAPRKSQDPVRTAA